jgi:hypothetical protein
MVDKFAFAVAGVVFRQGVDFVGVQSRSTGIGSLTISTKASVPLFDEEGDWDFGGILKFFLLDGLSELPEAMLEDGGLMPVALFTILHFLVLLFDITLCCLGVGCAFLCATQALSRSVLSFRMRTCL